MDGAISRDGADPFLNKSDYLANSSLAASLFF